MIKLLDKYLFFAVSAFFIVGFLYYEYSWSFYLFGMAGILYMLEKRNTIKKNFFTKDKKHTPYKYIIIVVYLSALSFILLTEFYEGSDQYIHYYLILFLLILLIIVILEIKNNKSLSLLEINFIETKKVKKFNPNIAQIIVGISLLYFVSFTGFQYFNYFFKIIVTVIIVLDTIHKYKKKNQIRNKPTL